MTANIRALIADDSYAATFQSMGQYRAALLKALAEPVGEVSPTLPPRPLLDDNAIQSYLVRYGVTWDGSPNTPLLTPMPDGYWTPWHIAARHATPRPVPVEVGERLPQLTKGDIDSSGRCWLFADTDDCRAYTHWLPHHAIPTPTEES